jgi:hypothetical protein
VITVIPNTSQYYHTGNPYAVAAGEGVGPGKRVAKKKAVSIDFGHQFLAKQRKRQQQFLRNS